MPLPGEALTGASLVRESAEAIVVGGNEPVNKAEDSQASEGLNVKLFQMMQGGIYQPCVKRNRETRMRD